MSTRERVDSLENALKELAYAGRRTEMSIDRLTEQNNRTSAKLDRLSEQTSANLDRLSEQTSAKMDRLSEQTSTKMDRLSEQTSAKLDRLSERVDQTTANLEQLSADLKAMNRDHNLEWGRLANKMGSFVEDMVVPNFPHILERYFGIDDVEDQLVRRRKPHPTDRSRKKEFDLIAWTSDIVFWNETKSNPSIEAFQPFLGDDTSVFEFFPELIGKKLVKIASALAMPTELVDFLTSHGCYAMMLGDETMDLVNFEAVSKRP